MRNMWRRECKDGWEPEYDIDQNELTNAIVNACPDNLFSHISMTS